jgi:hypothetical protein
LDVEDSVRLVYYWFFVAPMRKPASPPAGALVN